MEAVKNPDVDYVLTFEGLGAILWGTGIDVFECDEETIPEGASRDGREFSASNGVTNAVKALAPESADFKPILVDGLDSKIIRQMKMWATQSCHGNFVEVMSCEGGCMAGPGTLGNPRITGKQLNALLEQSPGIRNGSTV